MANEYVGIDSTVKIKILDDDSVEKWKVVEKALNNEIEISRDSALGDTLLDCCVGDTVTVNADPPYTIEIMEIQNPSSYKQKQLYHELQEETKTIKNSNNYKEIQNRDTANSYEAIRRKARYNNYIANLPFDILKRNNQNKEFQSRNVYFVFQGKTQARETDNNYLYVPLRNSNKNYHHWERMYDLRVGDIILHGLDQTINAVSIVKKECVREKRKTEKYEGYFVDIKYVARYKVLLKPLDLRKFRDIIIECQGENRGQGYPFNYKGKGNNGYLYNLSRDLSKIFLFEISKLNPEIALNAEISQYFI